MKYTFTDLDCMFCSRVKQSRCEGAICPYIMDNLPDLLEDKNFREAVSDAENCTTYHKTTLLRLKEEGVVNE